jgi:hypothetical protein
MEFGSTRFIVAMCFLVVVITGCSTGEQMIVKTGSGSGGGHNDHCDWTFQTENNGKLKPGTLHIVDKPGHHCSQDESGPPLFIGKPPDMHQLLPDTPPAEFLLKGTCRYCYLNSAGGMTCVIYPGC